MKHIMLFLAALSFTSLRGEESTLERHPIHTEKVSELEYLDKQQQRALLAEQQEESLKENDEKTSDDSEERVEQQINYLTTHFGIYRLPILVSPLGDEVELNDGTVWYVKQSDRFKTFNWLTTDQIILLPNNSWFSSYPFCLVNTVTGDQIQVTMRLGPFVNGPFTYYVIGIDYVARQVCLSDGSIWSIDYFDGKDLTKWFLNDPVLVGVTSALFSSPNILVNINIKNHYVSARCVQ